MMAWLLRCSGFLAITIFAAGCDANSPERSLVAAEGVVTMGGKPLAQATVEFIPLGETKGAGGSGVTDEMGRYKLFSRRGGTGVLPGEYRVTVSLWTHKDGSPLKPEENSIDTPDAIQRVPAIYTDMDRSPLKVYVDENSPNLPELKLESQVKR
jgi:hypothetical protein